MKEKRFDELLQMGYAVCGLLFIIFAIPGWLLDIELLLGISMIFLLYIPFMVCAITVFQVRKDRKREKRKRDREKRLRESKLLHCRSCDRTYNREDLDISPSEIPRCPICNKKLKPAD
ncbi:MAG: hypothetical protein RTU63_04740 [Candidatus Thorarchaeota archaeon]